MFEMAQFIRVYDENGCMERYFDSSIAVPVCTAITVASMDNHAVSTNITVSVPIPMYFHGGSFCHHTHTAFIVFHVPTSLAVQTSTIVISDYCLVLDHLMLVTC
jgi:hypothetical protein